MNISYKKTVITFLCTTVGVIFLFFAILYVYDPMQIFHRHWWSPPNRLHSDMRQQAAAIIRHHDFDSIILGTSMMENTSSNEAAALFGGRFVNISLSGGNIFERSILLKHTLKTKRLKTVIFSLDSNNYFSPRGERTTNPTTSWSYLYDDYFFNDFKVYLNRKFLICTTTFSKNEVCIGRRVDLDRPSAWHTAGRHAARFGGIHNWVRGEKNTRILRQLEKISDRSKQIEEGKKLPLHNTTEKTDKAIQFINENLLEVVREFPDTEFYIIFPPYSRLYYAMLAQYEITLWQIHLRIIEYMAEKGSQISNLQVFAYENEYFPDNLRLYKDPRHYHTSLNSWLLYAVSKGNGRITHENYKDYLEFATHQALAFDVVETGKIIAVELEKNRE